MTENNNKFKAGSGLKIFFIKLISVSVAVIIIINFLFNIILAEKKDITEEIVDQIVSKAAFKASVNVIKANDEMLGNILDIKT